MKVIKSGHIPDLYCVQLSKAASFCKNYATLYLNAKHSENGLIRGGEMLGSFSQKTALFS